ncbi:TonB-dependent receptor domain-containing protein [Luteimonas suaedae]|uniref:TonB-dependent receptor domain-containing protein n=1 Tax=Luteimonas suaedae TaxID=2605430 RepID=UPI0011EEDFB6|nr:TonB-dependent receptor [Luteimonas suaedae]
MNLRTPALRRGLLPAAILMAMTPAIGSAQEQASASDATTLDRIEVTGSRIRQVDLETAQPVLQITREDLQNQGYSSVADILENITSAGSPAISRASPLSSGEAVGGTYIDLRNLGPQRTLVLVNGRRLGITTGGLQDVSAIPTSMVERIEILKDGASTIYGSDAVAGVINIITRRNFDGAEAGAYYGQWGEGDGEVERYDIVIGSTGERTSLTFGAEYAKENPVFAPDRWFSRDTFPTGPNSAPIPGGASGARKEGQFGFGTAFDDEGNPYTPQYTLRRDVPNLDPTDFASYRLVDPALDQTYPGEQSTVYSGIERKSAFMSAIVDITDNISFETDLLYSDRDSYARNAGYPFQSAAFANSAGGLSEDSYFNPVGEAVSYVRRGWEVPREVLNSLTTYRISNTVRGSFDFGDSRFFDWDVGHLYNQNKGVQISTGNLNTLNVARATGASFRNADGVLQCGTPDNPITLGTGPNACTPWNPLIPFGYDAENSLADPNVQAYLYKPGQALSETETRAYFANISGTLFTLPAGDLGVAVGVEHRKESGSFSPDALAQTGDSTDLAAGPTGGSYSLDEIYAELQIPLLADMPFAQELTLNLASRYSDYDTFGDTTNSKAGFTWKPIESLLVRGTWSQGFRAPSISDLYGGESQSFEFYADPCDSVYGIAAGSERCLADVPADFRQRANTPDGFSESREDQSDRAFTSGSNPGLTPEESVSKTLGLVYSPSFAEGLNVALDWWNIRIDNTIIDDLPTAVLDDCYVRGIESRCSDLTGSRFTRDENGVITSFFYAGVNAGYQETEGYDLDVNYSMDTDYGLFRLSWLNTYVSKNELKQDNDDAVPPEQQNAFSGGAGINFRLRSNASLTWELGDIGVTWTTRYFSGVKESCLDAAELPELCSDPNYTAPDLSGAISPQNHIGSNTFHDVQVRWNAPWNATVSVGANNVFEHYSAPMYSNPASGSAYYGGYDIGRFMYMQYQQRF